LLVWKKDEVRPKCAAKEFIEDFANPMDYKSETEKSLSTYLKVAYVARISLLSN